VCEGLCNDYVRSCELVSLHHEFDQSLASAAVRESPHAVVILQAPSQMLADRESTACLAAKTTLSTCNYSRNLLAYCHMLSAMP
jgi:hypothetical protein